VLAVTPDKVGRGRTVIGRVTLAEQLNTFVTLYVIVALPPLCPVTNPLFGSTEAILLSEELNTPPDVVLLNVVDAPSQMIFVPVNGLIDGFELTVIGLETVFEQPVAILVTV
jgi:hypothetical protein